MDANIGGFLHILEGCRQHRVRHLVYASSSSVYGANTLLPFSVHDNTDHPLSLYGASKKANELMAHCYAYQYGMPCTGLRFFTVYGPWGRPDMALFLFTRAILQGDPIQLFNHGHMSRAFTYIDDAAEAVLCVLGRPPSGNPHWAETLDPASSAAPWRIFNVGGDRQVSLFRLIELLEDSLGKKAQKELLPLQPGDVPDTVADASDLKQTMGYEAQIPIEVGVPRFVGWYRDYYRV
jgi:UDP-glucuronate 4-epimerase